MLYFLVVKTHSPSPHVIDETVLNRISKRVPNSAMSDRFSWASRNQRTHVFYWINKNTGFGSEYFSNQSDNRLRLFNGWINDGHPLKTALKERGNGFDKSNYPGEYLSIDFDEYGEGRLLRSLTASAQVYYAADANCSVFSNRASVVNELINGNSSLQESVDPAFMAWIISTSWPQDDCSLFRRVKILKQNSSVRFTRDKAELVEEPGDIWHDEDLRSMYASDRKRYWNRCYEILNHNLNLLFAEYNQPFRFPLSGGKDSRLLLGLIRASKGRELVSGVFTKGTPYSGEVMAARIVCNALGLQHEFNDTDYVGASFDGKLHHHLYFTEGEVSPADLIWQYGKRTNGMYLSGQEVGLRNISNVVENDFAKVSQWFVKHFGRFSHTGMLSQEYVTRESEWFLANLEAQRSDVRDAVDLPTKNRIETRFLRWGARVWAAQNTVQFSPFIFLDTQLVKHTYNAGGAGRANEEFHFEMIKRADPRLLNLPFYRQSWPSKYGIETKIIDNYGVDERQLRGSGAIMTKNWTDIKKYLLRNSSREFLADIVDWKKLENFGEKDLLSGHYQPLWQMLQCSILADAASFTEESLDAATRDTLFPPLRDTPREKMDTSEIQKLKVDKYGGLLLDLLVSQAAGNGTTVEPDKVIAGLQIEPKENRAGKIKRYLKKLTGS